MSNMKREMKMKVILDSKVEMILVKMIMGMRKGYVPKTMIRILTLFKSIYPNRRKINPINQKIMSLNKMMDIFNQMMAKLIKKKMK